MRKYFCGLALLVLLGMMSSCEKGVTEEMAEQENTANGRVVIQVKDIENGWDGTASRALVNIAEVCTRLNFAVYQNGDKVNNKSQTNDESDFGTFTLELSEGSYQLLVVGHSGKANPKISTTSPQVNFTNPEAQNGTGFTDTFYYYGNLEVNAEGAHLSVNMKRATSMFRLVTSDAKPENIKKMWFYYEGGSGALNAVTGYGCVDSKQVVIEYLDDAQTGKPLQFDLYTFLHGESGNLTVTVRAFDEKDDIAYEREFTNVPMKRNYITRYTGNFFVKDTPDNPDNPDTPDNPDNPDDPDPGVSPSNVIMVDPEWGGVTDFTF